MKPAKTRLQSTMKDGFLRDCLVIYTKLATSISNDDTIKAYDLASCHRAKFKIIDIQFLFGWDLWIILLLYMTRSSCCLIYALLSLISASAPVCTGKYSYYLCSYLHRARQAGLAGTVWTWDVAWVKYLYLDVNFERKLHDTRCPFQEPPLHFTLLEIMCAQSFLCKIKKVIKHWRGLWEVMTGVVNVQLLWAQQCMLSYSSMTFFKSVFNQVSLNDLLLAALSTNKVFLIVGARRLL